MFVSPLEVLKTRLQTQELKGPDRYQGGFHIYGEGLPTPAINLCESHGWPCGWLKPSFVHVAARTAPILCCRIRQHWGPTVPWPISATHCTHRR